MKKIYWDQEENSKITDQLKKQDKFCNLSLGGLVATPERVRRPKNLKNVSLNSLMTEVPVIKKPLLCKSMDWFLYDTNLHHERVKSCKSSGKPSGLTL